MRKTLLAAAVVVGAAANPATAAPGEYQQFCNAFATGNKSCAAGLAQTFSTSVVQAMFCKVDDTRVDWFAKLAFVMIDTVAIDPNDAQQAKSIFKATGLFMIDSYKNGTMSLPPCSEILAHFTSIEKKFKSGG